MKETLKWLQGVGVAILVALAQTLQATVTQTTPGAEAGTLEWFLQAAIITLAARGAGWVIGKLPAQT